MTVADRYDRNFSIHITHGLGSLPGALVERAPDLSIGDSGLPCDTFNIVGCARLTGPVNDRIHATIDHFRKARRPFSWWVGPADQPRDLGRRLERAGLRPAESELAMAAALTDLELPPPPPGLTIRKLADTTQLGWFARVHAGASVPDEHVIQFYHRAARDLLATDSPRWFFGGYEGDEMVAVAEVTVFEQVAGLFGVMVRPESRGRGYGLAIGAAALQAARRAGADLGVLQAAEGVDGLYRKLGFESFGPIREFKPA